MENTNALWRYPLSNHSCCPSVNDNLWSWILRFISRRHTVLHFLHTTTAKSKAGHLIIRALFGMICSSEDIPFTRKFSWGALSASDNTDTILAGNDTATSPVTFTIHLRRWNMIVNVTMNHQLRMLYFRKAKMHRQKPTSILFQYVITSKFSFILPLLFAHKQSQPTLTCHFQRT